MERKLIISGRMTVLDEETFSPNEKRSRNFDWSSILSDKDDRIQEDFEKIVRAGGEVRGELFLTAQLLSEGRIRVSGDLNLFEGTSESTSDLDGSRNYAFIVRKDQTVTKDLIVYNEDEGSGDYTKVVMTIKNVMP